jgi:hypothetical protein
MSIEKLRTWSVAAFVVKLPVATFPLSKVTSSRVQVTGADAHVAESGDGYDGVSSPLRHSTVLACARVVAC